MATLAELAQAEIDKFVSAMSQPASDSGFFKITNFNVRRDHDVAEVLADIHKVDRETNTDVMCLQEAWQYIAEITAEFSPNWEVIAPNQDTTRSEAVPVLVRKGRFTVLASGTFLGSQDGAAPDVPERWNNWVRMHCSLTNRVVKVVGTHANSRVQDEGADISSQRVALYRDHMYRLREEALNTDDSVLLFFSADWNVDYKRRKQRVSFWPMRCFGEVGMVSNWSFMTGHLPQSTLQGAGHVSVFDQIYHRKDPAIRFRGTNLVDNDHSDHYAVVSAYALSNA